MLDRAGFVPKLESTSLWERKSKPGIPPSTYVMYVTASQYDVNVISGNEVMLRTMSTFRNRGTDLAA